MKWALRVFAFLDLVSFILMFGEGMVQLQSFFLNETFTINEIFSRFLYLLLWVSLLFSAIFLAIPKKAGIIIYYVQVIPRIMFLVFSVGFISYISHYVALQNLEQIFFSFFIFIEMLRLYFSYQIKKELF
jgi:glucose dehydrogenase